MNFNHIFMSFFSYLKLGKHMINDRNLKACKNSFFFLFRDFKIIKVNLIFRSWGVSKPSCYSSSKISIMKIFDVD